MSSLRRRVCVLPAVLALAATPAAAQTNLVRPGLGDDPGLPRGTALRLPPGVAVSGPVLGAYDAAECGGQVRGTGEAVTACLPLCNVNAQPVRVRLPAGLVLVSKSASRYQNGLLVEPVEVDVPPTPCGGGGTPLDKDPRELDREGPPPKPQGFMVALRLFCLNESMAPSETGVPYAVGLVTDDPDLLALLAKLSGKRLDGDAPVAIQRAVYSITEGGGLSASDQKAIAGL